jgi:hypothetical protein
VAGVVGNQDEWPLGREALSAYDLRPEIKADKGEEERPDDGRERVVTAVEIHLPSTVYYLQERYFYYSVILAKWQSGGGRRESILVKDRNLPYP